LSEKARRVRFRGAVFGSRRGRRASRGVDIYIILGKVVAIERKGHELDRTEAFVIVQIFVFDLNNTPSESAKDLDKSEDSHEQLVKAVEVADDGGDRPSPEEAEHEVRGDGVVVEPFLVPPDEFVSQ